MKHARKWLACLLAGALALAVLAGCSALMGGTVQKDTEQAKALMKEVDSSLTYNTDLEDAASRLADWLVEDSTQLTTQSGLLTRKVPMTTGSGAMLDTNVYDFIDHSTSFLFLPRGVVIGLAMNNEWGFTGFLPCNACSARVMVRASISSDFTEDTAPVSELFFCTP